MKDQDFTPKLEFPTFFVERLLQHKSVCSSHDAADRLAALVSWFRDLANTAAPTLVGMQRDATLAAGASQLKHLNDLLASSASTPVDWQNYLRNGIKQLDTGLDAASRGDFPVRDSHSALQGEDLIGFWRDTWAGFADALAAWQEIRQAAMALAENSQTPWE